MKLKKIAWVVFVLLAIGIGLYPLTFIGADTSKGLLGNKSQELLADTFWNLAFYTHIFLAGIALILGWSQFLTNFRKRNIRIHKTIGKVYIIAVLSSALAGFYIAYHATGGPIAGIGFAGMSTAWIVTTMMAYVAVRNGHIKKHQQWMIRSYAVTFTGVTFRLWLPFLIFICDMKFLEAYPIDAWVSWITNLVIAEFIIRKSFQKERTVPAHI